MRGTVRGALGDACASDGDAEAAAGGGGHRAPPPGEHADGHGLGPAEEALVNCLAARVLDRVLNEDERGIMVGDPQGSCGYLYVAAWLKPLNA
jgi:hypothetical protein